MLKGKATIILYCASSRGRGPRCAGWLQEVLFECRSKTKVLILEGGAKAFTEAFCDNDDLVQRLPDEVKE
jgi:arsenical-resistance protein 2